MGYQSKEGNTVSAVQFEFDGAESIAFWVSEDDTFETNVRVMFEDLPRLKAFLKDGYPGLFDEDAEELARLQAAYNEVVAEYAGFRTDFRKFVGGL